MYLSLSKVFVFRSVSIWRKFFDCDFLFFRHSATGATGILNLVNRGKQKLYCKVGEKNTIYLYKMPKI